MGELFKVILAYEFDNNNLQTDISYALFLDDGTFFDD